MKKKRLFCIQILFFSLNLSRIFKVVIFSEKKKHRCRIKQVSLYKYFRVLASHESKLIRTLVFSTKIKITHVTYTLCKDLEPTNKTEIIVQELSFVIHVTCISIATSQNFPAELRMPELCRKAARSCDCLYI